MGAWNLVHHSADQRCRSEDRNPRIGIWSPRSVEVGRLVDRFPFSIRQSPQSVAIASEDPPQIDQKGHHGHSGNRVISEAFPHVGLDQLNVILRQRTVP